MNNQDREKRQLTCESVAFVPMTISTPINLKPFIRSLPITASISGNPILEPTSCGTFILTQEICVKVPIEIMIESNIGNTFPNYVDSPIAHYPTKQKPMTTPNVVIDKRPCPSHNLVIY